ncbi:MAG TPA: formate dehydrogenase accessory sulfurtransferase FdhD, partial [Myxococcaceae bacterium]|nr:formate dehydrogenase accessory sulfurtransferase FdhD [Myxococcaceae bacterium]
GALIQQRLVSAESAIRLGNRPAIAPDSAPALLVVSGRASFEIVQKATVARIPIVASVSAPSSLAIDLAQRSGITLAGFVRHGSLNAYTHPERIAGLVR